MINGEVPLEVISRMLDHGSLQMTEVYARLSDAQAARALRQLPRADQPPRREGHVDCRRGAGRGRVDQGTPRPRAPGAAQRLLRPAAAAALPAPERLPSCESFLTDLTFLACIASTSRGSSSNSSRPASSGWQRIAESNECRSVNLINIIEGLERLDGRERERRSCRLTGAAGALSAAASAQERGRERPCQRRAQRARTRAASRDHLPGRRPRGRSVTPVALHPARAARRDRAVARR